MSEAALLNLIVDVLSGKAAPDQAIVYHETASGFRVVRPGDEPWFPAADWKPASVASVDGDTARLVLLDAIRPGTGALTLCLALIAKHGLKPAIIAPTPELADALLRRGWEWERRKGLAGIVWTPATRRKGAR